MANVCPICGTGYSLPGVECCSVCKYNIVGDVFLSELLNRPSDSEIAEYENKLAKYKNEWLQTEKSNGHLGNILSSDTGTTVDPRGFDKPALSPNTSYIQFESVSDQFEELNKSGFIQGNITIFSLEMISVEGSVFKMGCTEEQGCKMYNEKPVHDVSLSNFHISKYPVTHNHWEAIMGYNPSPFENGSQPVDSISWFDAVGFCNRLSKLDNLQPAYKTKDGIVECNFCANGYRLPTEAEWEYAARGGVKSKKFKFSGSSKAGQIGWYKVNSGGGPHEAGSKQPNELGIYDMSGNLREWCWDWFDTYEDSLRLDPQGPFDGVEKVIRGGSWSDDENCIRVAWRGKADPSSKSGETGFRVVRRY